MCLINAHDSSQHSAVPYSHLPFLSVLIELKKKKNPQPHKLSHLRKKCVVVVASACVCLSVNWFVFEVDALYSRVCVRQRM